MRNLIITPSFGIAYSEYEVNDLEDWDINAGLQIEYGVNRYLSVGARYKYENREFSGFRTRPGLDAGL